MSSLKEDERSERLEKLAENLRKFFGVDQIGENQVTVFYHYCRSSQVLSDLFKELLGISMNCLHQPTELIDCLVVFDQEQEAALAKRLLVHPDFPALFDKLYPGMLRSFFLDSPVKKEEKHG